MIVSSKSSFFGELSSDQLLLVSVVAGLRRFWGFSGGGSYNRYLQALQERSTSSVY